MKYGLASFRVLQVCALTVGKLIISLHSLSDRSRMPRFLDTNTTSFAITSRSFLAAALATQSETTRRVSQFDSWILQEADTTIPSTISAEKPSVNSSTTIKFRQSTMQSDYAKRIIEAPAAADAGNAPSEAPSCKFCLQFYGTTFYG